MKTLSLALAGLALAAPFVAGAQSPAAQAPARPFAGFTPGRCAVATRIIDGYARRPVADTGVYAPGSDTLFAASKDSVAMCRAAFGGATSDPTETLNQARVELYTRENAAAMATARRHMGTMAKRTPKERAWELYLVASDNLSGRPARIEPARKAITELDALGTAAASVRVLAHAQMAGTAWVRYEDDEVRKETSAAIAAWKELDTETKLWRANDLAGVFLTRAHLAALTADGEAARAVIDTARGIIPPAAAQARAMIEGAARMYRIMGRPAAELEAAFWFNAGEDGTRRPARGKVSLILPAQRPCAQWCPHMMRAMHRFRDRYGSQGLQLTFHTQTYGFYADTAPASPYDEARYDSTYFLGEVNIPGALAIAETQYSWKADGRRVNSATANQTNYPATAVAFVDRRGVIRYVASSWQRSLEARYARFVERLLAEDPNAPPPATPAATPKPATPAGRTAP